MLTTTSRISHHDEVPISDEEMTPTLASMIVLTWFRLVDKNLPTLVKQRYGTELRSKTLASLKPEISQALDSLLDEIQVSNEAKVLRSTFHKPGSTKPKQKQKNVLCASKPDVRSSTIS